MSTEFLTLCVILLVLTAFGGLLCCRAIARASGTYVNLKCLIIANYILIQPVSGIVHLTRGSGGFRGYYDLLQGDARTTFMATIICVLGMVALCVACMRGWRPVRRGDAAIRHQWLSKTEIWIICVAAALMLVPALNAFVMLTSYVAELRAARVIAVDGGLARYAFIANWLVWVITLIALLIVGRRTPAPPWITLVVVGCAVVLIAASVSWTGGRSLVLLLVLPLILTLLPRLRRVQWFALPVAAVSSIVYLVTVSATRSNSLVHGTGVSLANWLDWEWGRFSASGFASRYVGEQGLLYGETFLRGVTAAVLAPLKLVGLPVPYLDLRSTTEITGLEILGNSDLIYIVPGLSAELYMNFGLLGILLGYYFLGRVCVTVDAWIASTSGVLERLALYFVGAVLLLRTIPMDSSAFYVFVFFTGFPLLACAWAARLLRRRAAHALPAATPPRGRRPLPGASVPGSRPARLPAGQGSPKLYRQPSSEDEY